MGATVIIPSARQPVTYLDESGKQVFSRPWFLFFQNVVERLGGSSGPGIGDLEETVDDGDTDAQLAATVYALTDEMRSQPKDAVANPDVSLTAELAGVRDEIAELRKLVEGIQQGTTL